MAEPVTIGGQTFVKTGDGWVDQKSKIRAPEGLLSLLNKLQVENSPEGKKKRVRIDTSRPIVKLGKTEYVWDLNSNVWIDKKTKDAANPAFSKLIEAAYQGIIEGTTEEEKLYESWAKKAAAGQVFAGMGATGQAGKQKIKTRTGSGQLPAPSIKINSPIIQMIEKLATIDGYLKQRLDNQKKIAANNNIAAREASIEASGQLDAAPVIDEEKIKEEAEKENEKSNGAILAVAAIAAATLVSQLEPVKEAFSSIVDFAKGIYGYFKDFVNLTNAGLESINSMFGEDLPTKENDNKSSAGAGSTSTPAASPDATASSPASTVPPKVAPNSGSTNTAAPSSGSSNVTARPNTSSRPPGMSNNSGSRSSAPSPTRSTSSPTPAPTQSTPSQAPAPAAAQSTPSPTATPAPTSTPAPNATPAPVTPAPPSATPNGSNYDGLRLKSREAISGGPSATKTVEFAKIVQAQVPELKYFSAFSDSYHKGFNSKHNQGLAFDFSIKDPSQSSAVAAKVKAAADANGYKVKIRDEYKDPSGPATGGHIHVTVLGPGTGSTIEGGSGNGSVFDKIMGAGVDLTQGAMEAIGIIARAAFGKQKAYSGSQLLDFNDTMSGNIDKAAREKTGAMVDSKTPEAATTTMPTAISMSATAGGSSSAQNMQSGSDQAGIQWYLARMGIDKVN